MSLAVIAMKQLGARIGQLPARTLIGGVRVYQLLVSPWLGPACRYEPSCSHYMIQAVQKYGLLRGSWKGLRRIARCHPWGGRGYDPP
jgi:putative membrane protein insertion efficiency factor